MFWSSMTGKGREFHPLRDSKNIKAIDYYDNETWKVDHTSENVSYDVRIMR